MTNAINIPDLKWEEKSAVQAALSRVSIRKYADRPVTREEIVRIVELAGKAPSSYNIQPWRFIAVTNPEDKAKLRQAAYDQPQVSGAPVVLVVTSDMTAALEALPETLHPGMPETSRESTRQMLLETYSAMPESARDAFGAGQTYIALGYLLLILESLGYGASPMLGFEPDKVRALFGLADHVQIPALVAFGWPDEAGFSQHRLPVASILKLA